MNVSVSCGSVAVSPGDAILADDRGVVVIASAHLVETIEAALHWQAKEQAFLQMLRENPTLCYPESTMKSSLQTGLSTTRKITIDKPRTIDFLGESLRGRVAAKAAKAG